MKRFALKDYLPLVYSLLFVLLSFDLGFPQAGKVSLHPAIGVTQITGDSELSDAGPGFGGELGIQFRLGKTISIISYAGLYQLNEVTQDEPFTTTYIPLSLNLRFNFFPNSRFNFYPEIGYGTAKFNLDNKGKQLPGRQESSISEWTEIIPLGIGVEYYINNRISLGISGHFTTASTDLLDNIEQSTVDRVLSIKFGGQFRLGRTSVFKTREPVTVGPDLDTSEGSPAPVGDNTESRPPSLPEPELEYPDSLPYKFDETQVKHLWGVVKEIWKDTRPESEEGDSLQISFYKQYYAALSLLIQKDYYNAKKKFARLVERYSNHPEAANCQYWLSECYYHSKELDLALEEYQKVFSFPNVNKHDDAQIKIALCHKYDGDLKAAENAFNKLLTLYPQSEHCVLAKKELKSINGK